MFQCDLYFILVESEFDQQMKMRKDPYQFIASSELTVIDNQQLINA